MKVSLFGKRLLANKSLLAMLIIVPIILSFIFGQILFDDYYKGESGETYMERVGLPKNQDGGRTYTPDLVYKEKIKNPTAQGKIQMMEEMRFTSTYYPSLQNLCKVSILFGTVLAAITGGSLITEGSIIYQIVNKKSRTSAFLEFFSYPLPFLLVIGVLSGLAVSTMARQVFSEDLITFSNSVLLPIGLIVISLLEGYLFGLFFSLSTSSKMIPVLGTLGVVFGTWLSIEATKILLPHYFFISSRLDILSVDRPILLVLGLCIWVILFGASYMIYLRRDFYR